MISIYETKALDEAAFLAAITGIRPWTSLDTLDNRAIYHFEKLPVAALRLWGTDDPLQSLLALRRDLYRSAQGLTRGEEE